MTAESPWGVRWTPEQIARINKPRTASTWGACACGRHTVATYQAREVGDQERHSRKRCIDRRAGSIVRGDW